MQLNYIFVTYDGYPFPIAKRLMDEGNKVYVSQVEDSKDLGVESGMNQKENPEEKERRLSMYEGIIDKIPLKDLLKAMKEIENKDDYFVIFDFNNMYKISEEILAMGYTKGLFPMEADFEREKDRNGSKKFVEENYPEVIVAPVHEFKKIDDAIEFLNENNKEIYVLKSDGNFVDTTMPLTKDPEFAKNELIREMKKNQKEYEKGFTLEEKIMDCVELAPQIAFWNGKPLYCQVEMETRNIGSQDIGFQTGGNQNLIIAADLEDDIIKMAFPKAVFDIAKDRKGLFIFDCGLLFDKEGNAYFTEFAGNRWGWGGVFSEISMARKEDRVASEYFEAIAEGRNPQKHKMGSTLSLYNLKADKEFAGMYKQGIPIQWHKEIDPSFFPYQIRRDDDAEEESNDIINVGYGNNLLGYTTGYGETLEEAADTLYSFEKHVAFNGVYYRPKEDFLSTEYVSSIPSRLKFIKKHGLMNEKAKSEEKSLEEILAKK